MFDPWVGKISWRREGQPTPVFLPGEFHGQRSLVGYSPWGHKKLDKTERLRLYFHGFSNHFHFASSELDMSGCTSFWNQRFLPCHLVLVPVPHSLDMSQVRSDTFPSKDGRFMPKYICIYPAHGKYQAHILAWFIFCVAVHTHQLTIQSQLTHCSPAPHEVKFSSPQTWIAAAESTLVLSDLPTFPKYDMQHMSTTSTNPPIYTRLWKWKC